MSANQYVIEQRFSEEGGKDAISRAAAWLTLQGDNIVVQNVVGDDDTLFLYYKMKTEPAKPVSLDTGSTTIGPGSYQFTSTNGS